MEPLPKLRSVVRTELQALNRPSRQTLEKKYKKDVWIMNRKELDHLRTDIKKESQKRHRFHQLLQNQQHAAYGSKNVFQYLTPAERLKTGLVSKKGMTLYDTNLPFLQTIDLSHFWDVLPVIQYLLPRMKNLRTLDLTGHIRTKGDESCTALNHALLHLKKLTMLKLRDNLLTIKCIMRMREGLEDLHNLKYLDLSENSLSIKDVSVLCSILSHLPHLETLNISHTFKSLAILNQTILHIPAPLLKLKHLNMNSNILSYQDFSFLLQLPNLQYLDVSRCRIHDDNVFQLAQYAQHLHKLEVLILDDNPITDACTDMILVLTHLKLLSVKHTSISSSKIQSIKGRLSIVTL